MTEPGGSVLEPGGQAGPVPGWIDIERRLVAVLAMDVAGYLRLMRQDENGTVARLGCGGRLANFAFVLWPRVDAWLGRRGW